MNLKKTFKYGIITSICISALFFFIYRVGDGIPFKEAILASSMGFVGIMIFFFFSAGFLFLLQKFVFKTLDNVKKEIQDKNKQLEIEVEKQN